MAVSIRGVCAWVLLAVAGCVFSGEKLPPPPPGVRTLDTHHLFTLPKSRDAWESRSEELKRRILMGAGLWPMPERTPLDVRVTGTHEGPDFIVDNVVLTTRPGFYLCGNLYRPKSRTGPFPAIVNPHGHWNDGRLTQEDDVPAAQSLKDKPAAGRANLTGIGVNLARRGFICFAYDMVGYVDTLQMQHRTFTKDDLRAWSWSVNLLGLQLWNSLRVVDYLESRPDVDKSRIGATGASGGGSQTFLLGAIDPRIAATVPVNMVSAHMQGGCLCENGPGLRVGTDNAEIAALMAPRPQLLISCTGDWTRNNLNEEFPHVRRVYELMGHGERVEAVQFHFQHNYNKDSREAMYAFFARWLKGVQSPPETPFELSGKALRVWTDSVKAPADALNETALRDRMIEEASAQFARAIPDSKAGWKKFSAIYGPALRTSLALNEPRVGPAPPRATQGTGVLIVSFDDEVGPDEAALSAALQPREMAVYTLRLAPIVTTEKAQLERFFCCYNRTPLGDRVQQILDAAATLRTAPELKWLNVVGLGRAGACVLFAQACGLECERVVSDVKGFESDAAFLPEFYAPGLRRAGDVRAAAILSARSNVLLLNASATTVEFGAANRLAPEIGGNVEFGAGKGAEDLARWLERK